MNVVGYRCKPSLGANIRCVLSKGLAISSLVVFVSACQTINGMGNFGANGEDNKPGALSLAEQTLISAGQEAEVAHKYDVAANAYGRLFERRPDDSLVLVPFIRNMRYSDRAKEISQFIDVNARHLLGDVHVKFEYAKVLLAAGRKLEALAALQELAIVTPKDWKVYSAMGIALDAMGKSSQAMKAYKQALDYSPENVVVMNNLAMSQAMNGQLSEAIKTLENAASINRKNAHVRQNLALLYAVNGDVEKAKSLAAMDLSSSDVEANLSFYRRFEGIQHE